MHRRTVSHKVWKIGMLVVLVVRALKYVFPNGILVASFVTLYFAVSEYVLRGSAFFVNPVAIFRYIHCISFTVNSWTRHPKLDFLIRLYHDILKLIYAFNNPCLIVKLKLILIKIICIFSDLNYLLAIDFFLIKHKYLTWEEDSVSVAETQSLAK